MNYLDLVVGNVYSNKEVAEAFSCSEQGGIRVGLKHKTITLVSKVVRRSETNPYQDKHMGNDGRIIYTGMGTKGDQELKGQNKRIAESRTNGFRLFYFEAYRANEYTYKGELILDDEPYFVDEPDLNNQIRKVIKFKLKLRTSVDVICVPEDVIKEYEKQEEKSIKNLSSDQLASLAVKVDSEPKTTKVVSEQYNRDVKVKHYTLRRANGKCDLCGEDAPFVTNKNEPYLESHHVISLADGGKDSIVNTVALCPNCHKEMHYGKNKQVSLNKLKSKLDHYIQNDNNISYEKQMELIELYKKNFGIED